MTKCSFFPDEPDVGVCQENIATSTGYIAGMATTKLLYTEDSTIILVYQYGMVNWNNYC